MFAEMKRFDSSDENVCKYVFSGEDAVVEAVLYKYGTYMDRTVICCSTMSGCPVGCKFCGTGNKFVRSLTWEEIVYQIKAVLMNKGIDRTMHNCKKFQIMFMSMGEPMLNWIETEKAIAVLHAAYPNAELLISTIGINFRPTGEQLFELSKEINKVGLQFSIHKSNDGDRDKLIPYKDKMNLQQIRDFGISWWRAVGRNPYLNYCIDGTNNTDRDFENLTNLFSPAVFNFTFSVVCSANETVKDAGYRNLEEITKFTDRFIEKGYNVRIFDPAGQDDIGAGCGMLWYTQEWMKKKDM
jgi:23S rRNA (adenine2503-C2)-methyltransferase